MQKKRKSAQTSCYCLKIRRATAFVTNHYDKILASCGVTVRQYSVLQNIALSEHCSIRELADMAELDRSTLARNLQPLRSQGLVVDTRQPGTRNCQLELTEAGRQTLAYGKQLWAEAQQEFIKKMGPEGITALENVLETLEAL